MTFGDVKVDMTARTVAARTVDHLMRQPRMKFEPDPENPAA